MEVAGKNVAASDDGCVAGKKNAHESGKADPEKCTVHVGENIKFYCEKHGSVGCGDCFVMEHEACKAKYIRDMSKDFTDSEQFKALLKTLEDLTFENRQSEKSATEKKKENQQMLDKVLKDIQIFRTDVNKYLDTIEATIVANAKSIMLDNIKQIESFEEDLKRISDEIEKMNQLLDTRVVQGNVLFINTVNCWSNITGIEGMNEQLQLQTIKKFNFESDQQLRKIVSGDGVLGRLKTKDIELKSKVTDTVETEVEDATKKQSKNPSTKVVKGARVKTNWTGSTGTIIKVNADGSVKVRWDTGAKGSKSVGAGYFEVSIVE